MAKPISQATATYIQASQINPDSPYGSLARSNILTLHDTPENFRFPTPAYKVLSSLYTLR